MTDREAFLAAIRETPDDDTPRLAFADWLGDTAEPREPDRAALIRVQCELAGLPPCDLAAPAGVCESAICSTCPGRRPLDIRETELLDRHSRGWIGMPAGVGHTVVKWERGFVDQLECSAAAWLAHADMILAEHPVRRVRLTTRPAIEDGPRGCRLVLRRGRWRTFARVGDDAARLLAAEWPGVEFELPPPPAEFALALETAEFARERLTEIVGRSNAAPFFGCPAGSLVCVGVDGALAAPGGPWRLVCRFRHTPEVGRLGDGPYPPADFAALLPPDATEVAT